MFSNFTNAYKPITHYPTADSSLPFSQYIAGCQAIIEERRKDLKGSPDDIKKIIEANSPFELYPAHPLRSHRKLKYGALLMHGLLDSPFSMRETAQRLTANGVLCRSILLPGHGTRPSDLMHATYDDWIEATAYGIKTLQQEVEHIYLVGYSTGALLSLYHALHQEHIAGVILFAPAIRIKPYIQFMTNLYYKLSIGENKRWLHRAKEDDYTKYRSIAYAPVYQVERLSHLITKEFRTQKLSCPMFMVMSENDETISSDAAIKFFKSNQHPNSQLILYSQQPLPQKDPRILMRQSNYPELNILNFSHVAIPFSPHNPHYGQFGDCPYASHPDTHKYLYRGYNRALDKVYPPLHKLGLMKRLPRELTYNPDFNFMTDSILDFVLAKSESNFDQSPISV